MNNMKLKIEESQRTALFAELHNYDLFAKENDYIEVTEWSNGEGYDVSINANPGAYFQITHGQFKSMKKLIKQLNNRPL
jgi:transcriptional regulator CtsR